MISLNTLQTVPPFAFDLPLNTRALAVAPEGEDAAPGWMSIDNKIWIRRNFDIERTVYSDSGDAVARIEFSPENLKFRYVGEEVEKDWKQLAATKELMVEVLEAIFIQLYASTPSPQAITHTEISRFSSLGWEVGAANTSVNRTRAVNRARLAALQKHPVNAASHPNHIETDLGNEPVADFVSRRLCAALTQIPISAPAQVEVNFCAKAEGAHIVLRMDGEFDLLWGCSFIDIKDDLVLIRQRPAAEELNLRKLGALRFLLTQTCALERALGAVDEPIEIELKINTLSSELNAMLRIAPSAWGFDIASASLTIDVDSLPTSLNFTCHMGSKKRQEK